MWILKKQLLEQLLKDNLPKEEASNIMRTIADWSPAKIGGKKYN
jgi:hypothetical protein